MNAKSSPVRILTVPPMRLFLLALACISLTACGGSSQDGAGNPGPDSGPDPGPGPGPGPGPEPGPELRWVQQDSGTNFDLTQVTAVDADHAWTVARDRLYRTVDGGANWVEMGMDFPGYIGDLIFFDPLNGWALVSYQLFSTSDGGDTWVERASISGWPLFAKMSFIDMSTGWVALSKNEIWRTTDGGASWTSSTFEPSIGSRSVAAVEFADSQVGWILTYNLAMTAPGAEILKTTDGGASWTPQLALPGYGTYFSDIATVSPTLAWVVGDDDGEIIFATTDGGATWVEQDRNTFSVGLRGVQFPYTNTGWAAGIKIKHTTDGGATWTFEKMPQIGFYDVFFVNATTGWAVGQNGLILKATMASEPEPTPEPGPESGWVLQDSGSLSHMTAISAIDADQVWTAGVFGSYTDLLRTQDGGSAWSFMGPGPYESGFGICPKMTQIRFFDQQNGWRHDSYKLQRTTDGGQSWTTHWNSVVARLSYMCWLSPTTGWVTPENGGLAKTTDGGETWTNLPLPPYFGFMRAVRFIEEEVGWIAVGRSGREEVYKTVNGGQTWTLQLTLPDNNGNDLIKDLVAVSADRAWLIGRLSGGLELIMATTDGATWTQQYSDGSSELNRVYFVDANTGWAVGRKIHHTTDGGATWTVQPTSQEWFRDLVFVDSTTGWVVGENGVIVKTTTGGQ